MLGLTLIGKGRVPENGGRLPNGVDDADGQVRSSNSTSPSLCLKDITHRPISQTLGEFRGMIGRAEYMLSIAEESLKPTELPSNPGFKLSIQREPLGVVFVTAPWNFPFLVSINSVLPAIIAGNSVLLKPSPQTPLAAERMQHAFELAGLPSGIIQAVHLNSPGLEHAVKHPLVKFISFTGSVSGGRAVEKMAVEAENIKGVALEVNNNIF